MNFENSNLKYVKSFFVVTDFLVVVLVLLCYL